MKQEPEYAPQYSKAERLRRLFIALAITLPIFAFLQFIFFPWLRDFSANAACRSLWGMSGHHIVFYGTFVGIPLLIFIGAGISLLPDILRIMASGQYPPPGRKTYHPTRIRRGSRAILIAWLYTALLLFALGLSLLGVHHAHTILQNLHAKHPNGIPCELETPTR